MWAGGSLASSGPWGAFTPRIRTVGDANRAGRPDSCGVPSSYPFEERRLDTRTQLKTRARSRYVSVSRPRSAISKRRGRSSHFGGQTGMSAPRAFVERDTRTKQEIQAGKPVLRSTPPSTPPITDSADSAEGSSSSASAGVALCSAPRGSSASGLGRPSWRRVCRGGSAR